MNMFFFNDISDYLTNKFDFIQREEFQQSYLDYLNRNNFKNEQCIISKKISFFIWR